jgi:hypothetical protein
MRIAALLLISSTALLAQKNELAFSIGGFTPVTRDSVELSSGKTLGVNYGRRIATFGAAALYGELNFIANPQRLVTSSNVRATRDIATLFITPGVRLKFLPAARVSPYVVAGGGYGAFEQSKARLDNAPNEAPRELSRGVIDYGGGIDVKALRWLAFRGEVRDFYSGSPAYNVPGARGGQHNVAATVAFVLRFGSE